MCEPSYVIVTDDENEQPMELPAEADGTLLLSTLSAQFTGACGLKYFNAGSNSHRGVRLADGRLHPPDGEWGSRLYTCVFPKSKGLMLKLTRAKNFETHNFNLLNCCLLTPGVFVVFPVRSFSSVTGTNSLNSNF